MVKEILARVCPPELMEAMGLRPTCGGWGEEAHAWGFIKVFTIFCTF